MYNLELPEFVVLQKFGLQFTPALITVDNLITPNGMFRHCKTDVALSTQKFSECTLFARNIVPNLLLN